MMKFLALLVLVSLGAATNVEKKDRTITRVVKLLQVMLEKSVKEGDEERKIYAKFKCYCDQNEADKTASVEQLTTNIALLESDIEELQGSTGGLSSECADLKAKMAENVAARDEATTIRDKENNAFQAEEADLTQAIKQMKNAIDVLSKVGADQTESTGADNKQFMAGHKGASLLSLQSEVQTALKAATALMSPSQQSHATAFLQAPFTGTYSSQSGAVMGIIKNMRDTFTTNLADATVNEKNSKEAYDKLMKTLSEAHDEMEDSYEEKQKALGGNDMDLSTKRKQLSASEKQKKSDEEFLKSLLPMCEEKAAGFANRKMLRTNEEAAIAEAVSILNSDEAFASFGKTDATTSGSLKFIQLRSVHRHEDTRHIVQNVLQQAGKSVRLSKVLAKLQGGNPFSTVLDEIAKMITLIGEEADADKKNLDWCNSERTENDATHAKKEKEILGLETEIDRLEKLINNPEKGLKAQIAEAETSLENNAASQKKETDERRVENANYNTDVKNLETAASIITKAMTVLKAYYNDLAAKLEAGEAFLQTKKEDPTPPDAFQGGDGAYSGQKDQGGDVIGMLKFILEETEKEEDEAHKDEDQAQADFEAEIKKLKKAQKDTEENLASAQEQLAEAEKDLLDNNEDLDATTKDKEAVETYLLKIKPGCDFITANFDTREKNRATEETALRKAVSLIKATPAYQTAKNQATADSYGDCTTCNKDVDDVECKACMADVTIPAYCAGHQGTKGC